MAMNNIFFEDVAVSGLFYNPDIDRRICAVLLFIYRCDDRIIK